MKSKQILIPSLSIDIESNWNRLLCEVLHKINHDSKFFKSTHRKTKPIYFKECINFCVYLVHISNCPS